MATPLLTLEEVLDVVYAEPTYEVSLKLVVHRNKVQSITYGLGSNAQNNTTGASWKSVVAQFLMRRTFAKEELERHGATIQLLQGSAEKLFLPSKGEQAQ